MLWKQQHLAMEAARKDQEKAVGIAVDKSNQHSDQQIATVRDDVKSVKNELAKEAGNIRNLVSKSESDINTSIANVNKPTPPELARLQFSFFIEGTPTTNLPILTRSMSQDKDGNFSVDMFFTNISGTSAEALDVWIGVCQSCSFAAEPPGFDKPRGSDEHMRHKIIGLLNPGTSFEKTTIVVKLSQPVPFFELALRYSCKACGKQPDTQILKVFPLPAS